MAGSGAPAEPGKADTGKFKAGLEDVVAGTSSVCLVDGVEGRLLYRGYDIQDLAENSTFAETAFLLWYEHLPSKKEMDAYLRVCKEATELPYQVNMLLRLFPRTATPMEVLRTAISSLGHYDPDSGNTSPDAVLRKAIRLTNRIGPAREAGGRGNKTDKKQGQDLRLRPPRIQDRTPPRPPPPQVARAARQAPGPEQVFRDLAIGREHDFQSPEPPPELQSLT